MLAQHRSLGFEPVSPELKLVPLPLRLQKMFVAIFNENQSTVKLEHFEVKKVRGP